MRPEETGPAGVAHPPCVRILIVDDDLEFHDLYTRFLSLPGFGIECVSDGRKAIERLRQERFDVILSDIHMPGMDGLTLLKTVREIDLDVPVVLITGMPAIESAARAVEYGALRYLTKPVDVETLRNTVKYALQMHRMARLKRQALELLGTKGKKIGDRAGLEAAFWRALEQLWMAYQPIVRWSKRKLFAYEALMRSEEPNLSTPTDLLDAAERLGSIQELARKVRRNVATMLTANREISQVFVNLHPLDLNDTVLYSPKAELSAHAGRVVLEITERASLHDVHDLQGKVSTLRELGFRIALDDLGAGYAGLSTFAQLQPDIVKVDMSLVRDIHREPTKLRLVRAVVDVCGELGAPVIAEGVEVPEERDTLVEAGCDLFQGYLFGRPGRPFPEPILD